MVLSDFKLSAFPTIANQPHVLPRLPGTLMAVMVAVEQGSVAKEDSQDCTCE